MFKIVPTSLGDINEKPTSATTMCVVGGGNVNPIKKHFGHIVI